MGIDVIDINAIINPAYRSGSLPIPLSIPDPIFYEGKSIQRRFMVSKNPDQLKTIKL